MKQEPDNARIEPGRTTAMLSQGESNGREHPPGASGRLDEERLEALLRLNQMTDAPLNEITHFAMEEAVRLTGSQIGYVAFLDKDETVLTMHAWSQTAMALCRIAQKPLTYPLETTGLWGEAVRQRRPVVTNDYDAPDPLKKGYPEGHVAVRRHMNAPVFDGERIVIVAGVGNKAEPYDEADVRQLTLLMTGMWRIVERKRTEEALRESEEKYRILVENAGEAIFVAQDEMLKFANAKTEQMIGYSRQEIGSRPFIDFIHPEDRALVLERHLKRLQGEALPSAYRFRIVTRAGEPRWVELNTAVIRWEGRPATLNFLADITERKSLEAQLLQAQKMESVGRLAGGVAHDFNNMLGVILGHSELALQQVDPCQPLYSGLQEIRKAALRSAALTRQLLAFARRQTITPKVLDLNETVAGMLSMLRRLIGEDIDLVWMPGAALWPVKMDPSQIDQVLANLCVNARDAIAGVGKITIQTENAVLDQASISVHPELACGEYVLLAVGDDGCGMDKATLDQLFEPFFTTKEIGKGTGLGLATVYGIVKQNDGLVNVFSRPGRGTTFRIYLPRYVAAGVEQRGDGHAAEVLTPGNETILLVEDEAAILTLTTLMLEQQGYTVLAAATPGEAMRLAETHPGKIDLLMTDVVMPEMNGRDLAEKLTTRHPDLKRLFISGYTADAIAHHGVLDPGVNFLQKPFSTRDLAAGVRVALADP